MSNRGLEGQQMNKGILRGVPEMKMTRWHNPTKHLQTVIIADGGQPFAFIVQPGETRELPSKYDRVIHMVDCGKNECHRKGWWCQAGHSGAVMGGEAPLLVREGFEDTLDPTLDPVVQAEKDASAAADAAAKLDAAKAAAELQVAKSLTAAKAATPESNQSGPSPKRGQHSG